MRLVLLDTDVLIEILRERDETIVTRWRQMAGGDDLLFCTPVNIAEVWHGMRKHEEGPVLKLLECLVCLPSDAEIGRRAGSYLQRYFPSHGTGLADALVAATAAVHGCAVWTRNRKHFPMKDISFF